MVSNSDQNKKPSVDKVKEVKLFQIFSDDELQSLIKHGVSASYEAHANVIIEGEQTWGIYLLLTGSVSVSRFNKLAGKHYDIAHLREGDFFGEFSLIDHNARSATVRTLTDCHLFYITKEAFQEFLSQSNERKIKFYELCVKVLMNRLRELDDNYVNAQYQMWKHAIKIGATEVEESPERRAA